MENEAEIQEPDEAEQTICFDSMPEPDCLNMNINNGSNRPDIIKKYLVYMELPKIRLGDYRKSSCVSGNVIRFHFLLRIARDEANTALRLLPIKAYRAPVVNFAVIHRPFIEDEDARGPIPKSPAVRSPLIRYIDDDNDADTAEPAVDTKTEEIVEEFRSGKPSDNEADKPQPQPQSKPQPQPDPEPEPQPQSQPREIQWAQEKSTPIKEADPPLSQQMAEEPDNDEEKQFEVESPWRQPLEQPPPPPPSVSPARLLSDDHMTDASAPRLMRSQRRPKRYFVYCEIPKVLIGDYRNSSVICSEIIHAHFLMKIAQDEVSGQPQLQPIKRYHKPKVNFAVIHRALLTDDDAIGPIPRRQGVMSPMIKEDEEDVEDAADKEFQYLAGHQQESKDEILHATMGFCYGRMPRSKYELITQWSMVPNASGVRYPELVLSKAEA